MTATLPFGFRAVLSRFFEEETIHLNCSHAENIDTVLASATKAGHLTAYEKTALVQAEIHSIAQDIWGKNGAELLDRNRMRHILSLARLHFSVQEMKDGGFARFLALKSMYAEKQKFLLENDEGKCATRGAKIIRNWRIRHVRPLLFYYPFAVRAAIERGCLQCEMVNPSRLHERVANELALANLALSRLKRQD